MDDASHPQHALFTQSLTSMQRFEARIGRTPDEHTRNVARALTVTAHREGITAIEDVEMGEDGARLFAVQGQPAQDIQQRTAR